MKKKNEVVVCADGFTMSVQASEYTYCEPRDDYGPYAAVEIGFPSEKEPLIMPYCEDTEDPTGTVYGYVPTSVVSLVLAKHGGMISGELPLGVPQLKADYGID